MTWRRTGSTCLLVLLACGCRQSAEQRSSDRQPTIQVGAGLPQLKLIPLQLTDDDYPTSALGTIALAASGFLVYRINPHDEPLLRTVDSTGKVVARWGRRGDGPGELRGDELLLSGGSAIAAAGTGGERVRVYAPTGELLSEKSQPPSGLPSNLEHGRIAWWGSTARGAGPRSELVIGHRGPVTLWCTEGECRTKLLEGTDSIVLAIDSAATPPGGGSWPPFALGAHYLYAADGYSYTIWRIELESLEHRTRIQRQIPARMVTPREYARADSGWTRLARNGIPAPGGRIHPDFDVERQFLRSQPLPHFQYLGLSIDERGRIWVIGKAADSTFVDVFADTTFVGRHMLDCRRTGYAGIVRGHWLAIGCEVNSLEHPYQPRLYRIVETSG